MATYAKRERRKRHVSLWKLEGSIWGPRAKTSDSRGFYDSAQVCVWCVWYVWGRLIYMDMCTLSGRLGVWGRLIYIDMCTLRVVV